MIKGSETLYKYEKNWLCTSIYLWLTNFSEVLKGHQRGSKNADDDVRSCAGKWSLTQLYDKLVEDFWIPVTQYKDGLGFNHVEQDRELELVGGAGDSANHNKTS